MADMMLGLDLGQLTDPTAASVIRRTMAVDRLGLPERDSRGRLLHRHDVIALKRYELGTPYGKIVEHVVGQLRRPEFRPLARLICDATGVGRPIVESFRAACATLEHVEVWAVSLTGGLACKPVGRHEWHVAKVELVGALAGAMGTGRLAIPPNLPFADVVKAEFQNFQARFTAAANETFNAKPGTHDDLLISLAMPCWVSGVSYAAMIEPEPGDHGLERERLALTAEMEALAEAEQAALEAEEQRAEIELADQLAREAEIERDPFDPRWWGD